MWIWYLGEPEEAGQFRCEIAIRKRAKDDEAEIRYSGRVHSIRIPPHRVKHLFNNFSVEITDFSPLVFWRLSVPRVPISKAELF